MDKHPQTSHISVCLMSDKLHISNSLIGMKYCHFILHYMQLSSFPSHVYIFKFQYHMLLWYSFHWKRNFPLTRSVLIGRCDIILPGSPMLLS